MSNENFVELGVDSTKVVSGVASGISSLDEFINKMVKVDAILTTLTKSTTSSLDKMLKQLDASLGESVTGIAAAQRNAGLAVAAGNREALVLVKQQNNALQVAYEQRLATQGRLQNQELAAWKAFGVNLGKVQQAQLKGLEFSSVLQFMPQKDITNNFTAPMHEAVAKLKAEQSLVAKALEEVEAKNLAAILSHKKALWGDIAKLEVLYKEYEAKLAVLQTEILDTESFLGKEAVLTKVLSKNAAAGAMLGRAEADALYTARNAVYTSTAKAHQAERDALEMAALTAQLSAEALLARLTAKNAAVGAMLGRAEADALFTARNAVYSTTAKTHQAERDALEMAALTGQLSAEALLARVIAKNAAVGAMLGRAEADALFTARNVVYTTTAKAHQAERDALEMAALTSQLSAEALLARVTAKNAAVGAMLGRAEADALFTARNAVYSAEAKIRQAEHDAMEMALLTSKLNTEAILARITAKNTEAGLMAGRAEANAFYKARNAGYTSLASLRSQYTDPTAMLEMDKLRPSLSFSTAELDKTTTAMQKAGTASNTLGGHFKKLTIDGNDLHSMARGLASGFGLLWLTWGNMVPLLAGAAISMSFVKAMKDGIAFAESLAIIQTLAGATGEDISGMTKQVLELGASTPYGPLQLANALKVLSLAGFDAKDSMMALKSTMDFALAGSVTAEKAAETLVAVSTAYGYSATQVSVVGDIIAKTAAISMTSVDKMSESFKVASTVAQQFGVTLQDSALQLAFLSQIGITGTAAGTAMTNYYTNIVMGSKASSKALKDLGITVLDSVGNVKAAGKLTGELLEVLSTKTVEAQNKYLSALTTNRGLKTLAADFAAFNKVVLELNPAEAAHIKLLEDQGNAAEAAAEKARLATTQFKKFQEQIQDAPGFTAIAAAGMNLTPENQLKGIKASLETDLVKAFAAVNDQLFITSQTLRNVLNSPEFQAAITAMVVGAVYLIEKLVQLTAWSRDFVPNFGATVSAIWDAVPAAAAYTAIVIGAVLAMEGMAAASALAAAGVGFLSAAFVGLRAAMAAHPILLIVSLLAAGVAIYTNLTSRAKEYTKSVEEEAKALTEANRLRNISFLDSIQSSIDSVKARLEAARSNKSIEQTQAELALASHTARLTQIRDQELAMANLGRTTAMVLLIQNPKDKSAQASITLMDERVQQASITWLRGVETAKDKVAELIRLSNELAAIPVKARKTGTETGPADKAHLTAFKIVQDQETEILVKAMSEQEKVMSNHTSNELTRLQDLNRNKLISDGEYANLTLALVMKSEENKIGFLNQAAEKRAEALDSDVAKVTAAFTEQANATKKLAGKDAESFTKWLSEGTQKLATDIGRLTATYLAWVETTNTSKAKSEENAFTKMSQATNKLRGDIVAVQKAYSEFNIKEQQHYDKINRQASLDDQMRYASPEARAWLSATSAEHERLTTQIQALEKQTREATRAAEEFKGAIITDADQQQQYDNILLSVKKLRTELAAIKSGMGDKILDAGARANLESAKKNVALLAGTVTDSLETAFRDGGEKGANQLRKYLEDAFLRNPLKIWITGMLGSVFTTQAMAGAAGSAVGGAAGSSAMGAAGGAAAGYSASSWLTSAGFESGIADLSVNIGNSLMRSGSETLTSLGAKMGSNATQIGEVAGQLGNAMAWINVAYNLSQGKLGAAIGGAVGMYFGPIGSFIGSMVGGWVDKMTGGETRAGGQYRDTGTGAVFVGGPSGGEIAPKTVLSQIASTEKTINSIFKSVGSSAYLTGYQAGLELSDNNRGGVGAGGTLSNGATFGQSLTGSVYNGTMFDSTKGFNMTAETVGKAFTTELGQSIIEALSAATDLPKTISDIINTTLVNVSVGSIAELTDVQTTDLLNVLNTTIGTVTSFKEAVMLLPFEHLKNLSFDAAAGLIAAAGGMDKLGTNLATYYDKFYDPDEKRAQSIKNINAIMETGAPQFHFDAATATRDYYRSLVDGQEVITTAGQQTFAILLSIAGAFDEVNPAAAAAAATVDKVTESLKSTNASLLLQLETAKGNLMAGAGVDVNNAEQVALYNSNVALTKQIKVLNDHAATLNTLTTTGKSLDDQYNKLTMSEEAYRLTQIVGMDAAEIAAYDYNKSIEALIASHNKAAVIASEAYSLETQLLQAQGNTVELRRRELELIDPSNRAIQRTIWDLADVKTAQDAYNTSLSTAKSGLATATSAYSSASSAVDALRAEGTNAYLAAVSAQTAAQAKLTELQLNAQIELANTANAAAKAMADLSAQLYEFINSTALAPTQNFSRVLAAALAGDQTAMGNLTGAATGAIGEAQSGSATQLDFIRSRAQILSQVASVAAIADLAGKKTKVVPSATDPIVAAQAELAAIKLEVAEALRVANAISAPLVSQQATLISRYTAALAVMTQASADMVAAAKVLSDIEKNTSNTVKTLAEFKEKLVIELTATAKSNIEKLITFVTNTDKLPADLLALALATANSFDKTINYIVGTALTSDNKILALSAANEFIRTFTFLAGATISAEVKHIAFDAVTAFDRTINVLAGAKLTDREYVAAFGAVTEASRTIKIIATSNMTDALMTQAFGVTTDVNRYVNLIAGSSLTGTLKEQAFGVGTEILRTVGLVAGSSMTDALKAQAFGVGSAISRSVELLTGSTLTGTLKSQAFDLGTDLSRAVGLTAGSTLSGVLKAQAFNAGTDISRTISLLAGTNSLTADQQTLALSVSSAMTKTISSIASTTWLSATDAALAMAASETVTKTFKAALGTGDADAIALAAAASDTITRTIAASGGTLTADQKMILDAAVSGNTTVTVTTTGAVEWTPDLLANMWLEGIFNATTGLWNAAGRGGDTGLLVKFARGTAAGESVWATGGAFTNGIVSSPTSFNMGLMGEAGPEAIMPLTNVGGSLGVRFAGDSANSALVSEIKSLREDNRAQALAIAQLNARMVKLLERWDGSGMPETRVTT